MVRHQCCFGAIAISVLMLISSGNAQDTRAWRDPSHHEVRFVSVDNDVRLEVLDWGGTGRAIVLLAGFGNTAHIFDDFAGRLSPAYHVYGITRRGFGASSVPAAGYGADRLGDDVLAVIEALKLDRPVLAGHSIAGQELSSIGTRHPDRIAGLVYLDAANQYAYDNGTILADLHRNLGELINRFAAPNSNRLEDLRLVNEVLNTNIPKARVELESIQDLLESPPPPPPQPPRPTEADLSNFAALSAWNVRVRGLRIPEAELRQTRATGSDGRVGAPRTAQHVGPAITAGMQRYRDIRVPVLALYAIPNDQGPWLQTAEPAVREAALSFGAAFAASQERMAQAFEKGVPTAKVVRLPGATHHMFISNESDVLREIRAFLLSLP